MRLRTSRASRTTSWPSTRACPLVGSSSVISILIVVVLPAPFGPSRPNSSPRSTLNETPRTASTSSGFRRITPVVVRYVLRSSMASITAMLSTLTAAVVVGYSAEHRPIEVVHVAGPGARVLVVVCIHGNEPAGIAIVRALERAHPNADLWLVPALNPDGLARGTRQNARGVDLNRNFAAGWRPFGPPGSVYAAGPRPFSEPETRVARAIVGRV